MHSKVVVALAVGSWTAETAFLVVVHFRRPGLRSSLIAGSPPYRSRSKRPKRASPALPIHLSHTIASIPEASALHGHVSGEYRSFTSHPTSVGGDAVTCRAPQITRRISASTRELSVISELVGITCTRRAMGVVSRCCTWPLAARVRAFACAPCVPHCSPCLLTRPHTEHLFVSSLCHALDTCAQ